MFPLIIIYYDAFLLQRGIQLLSPILLTLPILSQLYEIHLVKWCHEPYWRIERTKLPFHVTDKGIEHLWVKSLLSC